MSDLYLSEIELSRIKNYKPGITIDKSLIYRYLVSPACAKLVTYIPSWIAPNVLTLLGLVCNIFAFYLAVTHIPNNPNPPEWIYLACAGLIFTYMMLDNMDGKQAFRTGSSTPLGELLDHGCDSMIVGMGTIITGLIVNASLDNVLLWTAFGMPAFYLAHWQEYFSHFLELGYFNGPTEAECGAIAIYIMTFFLGRNFWITPVEVSGFLFNPNFIVHCIIGGGTVFTIFSTLWSGSVLAVKKNNVPLYKALSQLIPFAMTWLSAVSWIYLNPTIYYNNPFLFLVGMNFIFSYLTVNCILQRMLDLPYKLFYLPCLPLFFASVNSFVGYYTGKPLVNEVFVLFACVGFYLLLLVHFSVSIVNGLCRQLRINALTIPYPNKATKQ